MANHRPKKVKKETNELSFREKLDLAKDKAFDEFSIEVKLDEIEEGMVANCYPMLDGDRAELLEMHKDDELKDYALILVCYKDSDGNRLFNKDDIPFLKRLGFKIRMKLWMPAHQLAGIGEDFTIRKKQS
jgi:hypothetical protein